MKVNLSDDEVKKIKTQFSAYLELQDEKKELAEAVKACKEEVAQIIESNITDAGKLLRLLENITNGKDDDLGEISLISERVRGISFATGEKKEEEEEEEDDE